MSSCGHQPVRQWVEACLPPVLPARCQLPRQALAVVHAGFTPWTGAPSSQFQPSGPLQVAVTITLGVGLQGHTLQDIPKSAAVLTLVFICVYVAGFAW